ncbi:uncharacterized protein TRIADDRAFT_55669 [Trichoplax adhaerens]|uniref:Uncharacterized protein n=1 Tax=Trichoplax adhaerens TaxID=10228 RepID=B3RVI9_TRIAD|nr:predicted protein [Trichoplax adhaerens]EDV26003.1 predicted protein [Trichoplax adhaerens]|eukprot:XP_002112036.1 predicted protein [Trichoplax adhaerens]
MAEEETHSLAKEEHKSINYFNTKKEREVLTPFDRVQHVKEGYIAKLHRDDREHKLDLDINGEERERRVPILSSSEYGRRIPIEQPSRTHARLLSKHIYEE